MLKKIIVLLLILLILAGLGYYALYTQGAFDTKEEIYNNVGSETSTSMKCEAGKCAAGKCGAN